MTKALIFGTGGVGSVYGYILHKAGAEVTAVCRSNYEVVKEKGFLIRSAVFGKCEYKPIAVKSTSEAQGPFDFIVVCSKAFPGTAPLIKDAVSPSTAIVLAQNGIGIEEEYAQLYPANTIISGVVYLPVTQVELGVVEMGSVPIEKIEIGTFPAKASAQAKSQVQHFADLFAAGGATCKVFDDVQGPRWIKLSVNAPWNPICALTLCDDANLIRACDGAADLVREVMKQVGRVAKAAGHDILTDAVIESNLNRAIGRLKTGGKEPSMLTDIRNGRPIEVEAIIGNTVRIAKALGVSVPYLEMLYVLASGLNFSIAPTSDWIPIAREG